MIRPFEERDYEPIVALGARIDPDQPPSIEANRHRDRTWDPRYSKLRLVVTRAEQVLGWGQVAHMWWAFHPRHFVMRLQVDPTAQGRGLGSALYERLLQQLDEWDAELVRTDTNAARQATLDWLLHRDFSEIQRRIELRLAVVDVELARFPDPDQLLSARGIRATTLAAERAPGGERLLRELYDLEILGGEDEPRPEQGIAMSYDRFLTQELDEPSALPDGNFLAFEGERLIGMSRLQRDLARPGSLQQGFTTVHPDYRGRGIALALKLLTVRYAQANGYREIATGNDTTNAPMLHINQVLGFRERSRHLVFERRFDRPS